MQFVKATAIQDQDGHWYVIPTEMKQDFLDMEERGHHDEYEAFNERFSQYLTGGDLNLTQLYVPSDAPPPASPDREGWIRVEDGLPERLNHDTKVWCLWVTEAQSWCDVPADAERDDVYDEAFRENVTHWMKLPAPPTK